MRHRRVAVLGLLVAVIAVALVLMSLGSGDGPAGNGTIPHLSVRLANYSWGVQVEVTIDPYGENGWTWDNPFFHAGIVFYCMDMNTPDLCGPFGGGGGGMGQPDKIYYNITDSVHRCDTCLYGVYAVATNGSCWVLHKIMGNSGDLPVETGLDFSLEFRDGLVVYVRSPDGALPEIDELCIGWHLLSWDGQGRNGGLSTSILYRNETTLWSEPPDRIAGGLNASVLWFCRALGKDGTVYWSPVRLTHFGHPPPIFLQPEGWP